MMHPGTEIHSDIDFPVPHDCICGGSPAYTGQDHLLSFHFRSGCLQIQWLRRLRGKMSVQGDCTPRLHDRGYPSPDSYFGEKLSLRFTQTWTN